MGPAHDGGLLSEFAKIVLLFAIAEILTKESVYHVESIATLLLQK